MAKGRNLKEEDNKLDKERRALQAVDCGAGWRADVLTRYPLSGSRCPECMGVFSH